MININATLFIQLANFLLLMFLLNRILFRPMTRLLNERASRTKGRLADAQRLTDEAEAILQGYEQKVREARAEADAVRADMLRQADGERQKLVDAAADQAEKTLAEIRARVRGETEEARKVLREESRRLASAAAERILGRAV